MKHYRVLKNVRIRHLVSAFLLFAMSSSALATAINIDYKVPSAANVATYPKISTQQCPANTTTIVGYYNSDSHQSASSTAYAYPETNSYCSAPLSFTFSPLKTCLANSPTALTSASISSVSVSGGSATVTYSASATFYATDSSINAQVCRQVQANDQIYLFYACGKRTQYTNMISCCYTINGQDDPDCGFH